MAKIGWSPSQQEANQYAGGKTGYSDSEQYWMEALAAEVHRQWVDQRTGIPDVVFEKESFQANVKASNAAKVTAHVAMHTNAGGAEGCVIFYYPGSVQGKKMAEILYKHISKATDTTDLGVRSNSSLGELRSTSAPAVLIEYQFHDKSALAQEIRTSIKEYATATVKAMCEYHGKTYKYPAVVVPPVAALPVIAGPQVDEIVVQKGQVLTIKADIEAVKVRVRSALEA